MTKSSADVGWCACHLSYCTIFVASDTHVGKWGRRGRIAPAGVRDLAHENTSRHHALVNYHHAFSCFIIDPYPQLHLLPKPRELNYIELGIAKYRATRSATWTEWGDHIICPKCATIWKAPSRIDHHTSTKLIIPIHVYTTMKGQWTTSFRGISIKNRADTKHALSVKEDNNAWTWTSQKHTTESEQ